MASAKPQDVAPALLTDDQFADLQAYYALKIRTQRKKAAEAKAKYDLEAVEVNGFFKRVTADLKVTRKDFEEFLAKQDLTETEFLASETRRHKLFHNGGLPVGAQQKLFGEAADTVDDKVVARADGRRAYLRGEEAAPPSYIAAVMVQDWMAGWQEEQAKTGERLARAEKLIEERGKPAVDQAAVDLNAGATPEPGSPEELKQTAAARKSLDAVGDKTSRPKPTLVPVAGDTRTVRIPEQASA